MNMNGTIGFKAEEVNVFCERLRRSVNVPVETWDERLSTSMVERVLLDADVSRGKRRKVRDKLAAVLKRVDRADEAPKSPSPPPSNEPRPDPKPAS